MTWYNKVQEVPVMDATEEDTSQFLSQEQLAQLLSGVRRPPGHVLLQPRVAAPVKAARSTQEHVSRKTRSGGRVLSFCLGNRGGRPR